MKLNDLITTFTIQMSNEEHEVYEKIDNATPLALFSERDKFIIENLIRKSLISKVNNKGHVLVVKNENPA